MQTLVHTQSKEGILKYSNCEFNALSITPSSPHKVNLKKKTHKEREKSLRDFSSRLGEIFLAFL